MILKKCPKGHYYDTEKNKRCPFCSDIPITEPPFISLRTIEEIKNDYKAGIKNYKAGKYDDAVEFFAKVVWSYNASDKIRQNAFSYLKKLADNGNKNALVECGNIFIEGGKGWCDPVVKLPDGSVARVVLSDFKITEVNPVKALDYYSRAADMGDPFAMTECGDLLMNIHRTEEDEWKAFYYYQKAAEANDRKAQLELSKMYMAGIGTPVNLEKAKKWLVRVIELDPDDVFADSAKDYLADIG